MADNATTNVSLGKPKIGGSIYVAPKDTAIPSDATTALNSAFNNVGYISEDGLKNNNSPETENIKAWGGDVVKTAQTGKPDTFTFAMIEALNTTALGVAYGRTNVSGALATGITVRANAKKLEENAFVIEMILNEDTLKRIVIPQAQVTEVGEITYVDNELISYDVTITALPNAGIDFDTHREYIQTAPANANVSGGRGVTK